MSLFGLNICRLGPTHLCLQKPHKKKVCFPNTTWLFLLANCCWVSGCAGKLILKYLMASHLGTFHLLFMQWLLFSFSVFYNPIQITSNLLTLETTTNNDSGQKDEAPAFWNWFHVFYSHRLGEKHLTVLAKLSFRLFLRLLAIFLVCSVAFFFVFIFGSIAISGLAMALFVPRQSELAGGVKGPKSVYCAPKLAPFLWPQLFNFNVFLLRWICRKDLLKWSTK